MVLKVCNFNSIQTYNACQLDHRMGNDGALV